MKVAMLHAPGDLRLDEAAAPTAGPGDLVVKVGAAGICGTDLHWLHMGPRYAGQPMALGHEFAGEVVDAGRDVKSFKLGDRVAYNSSNSPADMGRGGESGGFAEYVVLRDVDDQVQALCRVPDEVSLEHAALVEPMAVAEHAVNRAAVQPGESAVVFGVGPIGLGMVMSLRMQGVEDIVAFDLSKLRRDRALSLGARAALDPRERPPAEVLGELRGTAKRWGVAYPKTDVYLETSGAKGLMQEVVDFCAAGSRIVTVAMNREPVSLDVNKVMSKEISIVGSSGYPREFPEVMTKLAGRKVDPEAMITHRLPFHDFLNAFEVAKDAGTAAKVLLTFD
jgi:2-desacetyl-2-hydroxyethyl bacteriochlorophyllide A dehydrogenase